MFHCVCTEHAKIIDMFRELEPCICGNAHGDDVAVGVGGVTLKITMQATILLCSYQ